MVELRDIVTRFGDKTVHDGISFDIRRGEVFAIVGGSGSGKSTLMREIVMLHSPDGGSVKLFGEDATEAMLEDLKRRMLTGEFSPERLIQ